LYFLRATRYSAEIEAVKTVDKYIRMTKGIITAASEQERHNEERDTWPVNKYHPANYLTSTISY
jgi:hypothetical protein